MAIRLTADSTINDEIGASSKYWWEHFQRFEDDQLSILFDSSKAVGYKKDVIEIENSPEQILTLSYFYSHLLALICQENDSYSRFEVKSVFDNLTTSNFRVESSICADEFSAAWIAIERRYIIGDKDAMKIFLLNNPDLVEFLIVAYNKIQGVFGTGSEIEITTVTDPEFEDSERVFGYIFTDLPIEEAFVLMEELDSSWLLAAIRAADGKLNFNLRFR